MVLTYDAHPCFYLAEIMGNNVDMKKLRAKLGGRRDFRTDLQAAKRQKSDASTFPNAAPAKHESSAPADSAASTSPHPAEAAKQIGASNLSAITGVTPSEPAPEVINLEGSPEGGAGSPRPFTEPSPAIKAQPSMTDVTTSSRPQASGPTSRGPGPTIRLDHLSINYPGVQSNWHVVR